MTLKNSSHKQFIAMFRQSVKQTIVLPLLAFVCLIFFSLMEVEAFKNAGVLGDTLFFWDDLRNVNSSALNNIVSLAFIIAGVINALILFNFAWSKKHSNVIFSLGMKRSDIYSAKLMGGLTPMVCAILLAGVFEFINVVICGLSPDLRFLEMAILTVTQYTVIYILAFTLSCAVMSNSGNIVEAIVFTAILSVFGTVFEIFLEYSFWDFTHGAASTTIFEVTHPQFNWSEPLIAFNYKYNENFLTAYFQNADLKINIYHWSGIICATIYSVILAFLGCLSFKKRKNEISGTWGRAKGIKEIVSAVTGFYLATFLSFTIFNSDHGNGSFYTFIVFSVTFIISNLIFKMIFGYRRKKELQKALKTYPAYIAGTAVAFIIFSSGFFGYSSYVPEKNEIASIKVSTPHYIFMDDMLGGESYCGLRQHNEMIYRINIRPSIREGGIYYGHYFNEVCTGVIFTSDKDIDQALNLHKKLISDGKIKNNAPDAVGTHIMITYTMKDGSTHKRYYTEATESTFVEMLLLNDMQPVKNTLHDYANINIDIENYRNMFNGTDTNLDNDETMILNDFYETNHDSAVYFFNQSEMLLLNPCYIFPKDMSESYKLGFIDEELYKAILTDIANLTSEQYFHHSAEDEIGILSFGLSDSRAMIMGESDGDSEKAQQEEILSTSWNINSHDIKTVVVTKDMKNTVKYLEEHDLMKHFEPRRDTSDIKHIKLATMSELYGENKNSYNVPVFYAAYWTGEQMKLWENKYGKRTYCFGNIKSTITDKNKIQSLLDDSVVFGFCSNDCKIMEITYSDGAVSTVMIPAGSDSIK